MKIIRPILCRCEIWEHIGDLFTTDGDKTQIGFHVGDQLLSDREPQVIASTAQNLFSCSSSVPQFCRPVPTCDEGDVMTGSCQENAVECPLNSRAEDHDSHCVLFLLV